MQNSQASLKNNGHWHAASIQEVLGLFNSSLKGLDSAEAAKRLIEAGPNRLDAAKKRTPLGLFFSQFKDFMILLLLFAACVSAFAGDLKDTIAIAAILVLNAVIGFTQEYRAERAMEALRAMAAPNASVLRDGNVTVIAASDLVPGDMVLLEAGRIVPADLRLVESA